MRTARLTAAVLTAGLTSALAGCAPAAAPPPPPVRKVSVRLLQYRSDIAPHRIQLEVVNGSARTVVVRSARILDSGYRTPPTWHDPVEAEIPAGATVDLPTALGAPTCPGTPSPRAELTVLQGGTTAAVRVPTADSHDTLATLHRGDCFAAETARIAGLSFRSITPGAGGTAALTLDMHPGPDAARGLEVLQVLPTNLVSPTRSRAEWTVGRRIGTAGEPIVLAAVPTRCDLHAIAEDKVGSVLPVLLRLPDGRSGLVQVAAPNAVRDDVLRWVSDTCATGR